eukprot:5187600-Prymnesium_polylepis.1
MLWNGVVGQHPPERLRAGSFAPAVLNGLRAAVASLRLQDAERRIIIMVTDPRAPDFAPLVEVASAFAHITIVPVEPIAAWDLHSGDCMARVKSGINRLNKMLNSSGLGDEDTRAGLAAWPRRRYWKRNFNKHFVDAGVRKIRSLLQTQHETLARLP